MTVRTVPRLRRAARPEELVVGLVPYVVLGGLVLWLWAMEPASLEWAQLMSTLNISIVLILIAVGQTFVLLTGGIDLSVGGVVSTVNALIASSLIEGSSAWPWVAGLVLLGWLPGALNGFLIAYVNLQPFIVTLATWFIWAGVAFYLLPSAGGQVDPSLGSLSSGELLGIENSLWLLLLVVAGSSWFLRTRSGLQIKSIGSSVESARQSGVPTRRVTLLTYGLSSWFAVLAGIVLSAQSLSGDPTVGNSYILLSVAAAVIGGTSLFGGRGTATGSVVGALINTYLLSVVFALGMRSQWSLIFSGVLLILSVSFQLLVRRGLGRKGSN